MSKRPNIALCGYPRSGTTLLYNMLRATVVGYQFYDRERSMLRNISGARSVISKFPSDVFYGAQIVKRDPGARFLATIRDARDVICDKYRGEYVVDARRTHFGQPGRNSLYRPELGLVDWDRAIDALPDPVIVRYEDLVRDPAGEQRRICEALGLEAQGAFADFHRHPIPPGLTHQLNGVRPVDTNSIGAWREHPERVKGQFCAHPELFDVLARRDYEEGREWLGSLS